MTNPPAEDDAAPLIAAAEPIASSRLGFETLVLRFGTYAYALPGTIVLARALGPSGRGSYQVAVTTSLVVLTLALAGLPQSLYRSWGSRSGAELLAVSRLVGLCFGGIATMTCVAIALLGADIFGAGTGRALLLIGCTLPIQLHAACTAVILQLESRTRAVNLATAVGGIVQTSLILGLWGIARLSVLTAAAAYAIGVSCHWILLRLALNALAPASCLFPVRATLELARSGLILQLFIVGQFLLLRIDVLLVARIAGLHELGIYSVAVTLAELVWLATDSLAHILIERTVRDEGPAALAVFVRAVRMTVLLGCGTALAAGLFAPFGIRVLYGQDFAEAAGVVSVLLPGAVMVAIWRTIGTAVVRYGSVWQQPMTALAALTINVILNLLLIDRFGSIGAAVSSTVAYGTLALAGIVWLLGRTGVRARALLPGREEFAALRRLMPDRA